MAPSEKNPSTRDRGSAAADAFRAEAERQPRGTVAEFVDFLRHNKKWWLTPVIVVLLLLGALVVLSGTGVAPFIYSLF